MTTPLIGLIGKKQVGKDTLAATLAAAHGFRRLAFADRLKESLILADPMIGASFDSSGFLREDRLAETVSAVGWETAKRTPEVRRLLQRYGVGMREVDPMVWVRPVLSDVAASTQPVVVTDVRFPNEADAIRSAGGRLVRVIRPQVDDGDGHASESALPDVIADYDILNIGNVQVLLAHAPAIAALVGR